MAHDPEYQRKYYLRNRERRIAESCEYQRRDPGKRRQYNAEYYAANKAQIAKQAAAYRERTAESRKAKRRAEYAADPERFKREVKAWQVANPRKRLAQRLRRFGITVEQYESTLAEQRGVCAICLSAEPKGTGRFHVDHCHESGRVRGLLCSECNLGLGKFRDSTELLGRAAMYLRAHVGAPDPGQ